jgi:HEPN domain-containing protein
LDDSLGFLAWVELAEEDYALAQSALRRKTPLTYGATFHAQQCIEKYLKAVLITAQRAFPKTHDLVALGDLCVQIGVILPVDMDALEKMNAYSVLVRYPGVRPTVDDAKEVVHLMRSLRRFFKNYLGLAK